MKLQTIHYSSILRWLPLVILLALFTFQTVSAQELTPVPAEEVAEDIVGATVQVAESTANTFENFLNRLMQVPRSDIVRVLLVIGGVMLLAAGWRIYEFVILIAGFLIGAAIALSLVTPENSGLELVAFLVGGLIGAGLSFFLYNVAVFIIGAYLGIVITNGLGVLFGLAPISPLILLIGGILGGLILLGLSFQFLIVLAVLVGAQMLSLGLGLDTTWTLLFAAVGIIVQLGLMRTFNYSFRRPRSRAFFRRPRIA
jgi:hypothetical protein